jgi:hypothetical protein
MKGIFFIILALGAIGRAATLPAKELLEKLNHGDSESALQSLQTLGNRKPIDY